MLLCGRLWCNEHMSMPIYHGKAARGGKHFYMVLVFVWWRFCIVLLLAAYNHKRKVVTEERGSASSQGMSRGHSRLGMGVPGACKHVCMGGSKVSASPPPSLCSLYSKTR